MKLCTTAANGSNVVAVLKNRYGYGVKYLTLFAVCAAAAVLYLLQRLILRLEATYIRGDVYR